MFHKALTAVLGIGFVFYGLICFFMPESITSLIGYEATTSDARTEFLAMYGGVQTGLGIFGLLALRESSLMRANFLLLTIVFTALALGRLSGYIIMDNLGGYTHVAIVFETISALLCSLGFRNLNSD